ncbi:MAG: hypothetical protein QM498_16155 [Desulfobacterium sp.]
MNLAALAKDVMVFLVGEGFEEQPMGRIKFKLSGNCKHSHLYMLPKQQQHDIVIIK